MRFWRAFLPEDENCHGKVWSTHAWAEAQMKMDSLTKKETQKDRASCSEVSPKISRWEEGIGGVVESVGWDLQMTLQKVWRWQCHHLCTSVCVCVCARAMRNNRKVSVWRYCIIMSAGCRINAPLPPAVIHLPSCHFPFKPWLTCRKPRAPSELSWHLRALYILLLEVLLTHTHVHYPDMSCESYFGGGGWGGQVKSESDMTENTLQESEMISTMPPLQHILMLSKNCYSAGIWSDAARCVNGPKLLCMKLDWPWISQSHKCILGLT